MKMNRTILSTAAFAGITVFAGSAMAQDVAVDASATAETAPAAEEAPEAAEEAPAEAPPEEAPAEEPMAEEAPVEETMAAEAPAEEAAEEEASNTVGWFRVDHDKLGLQLWAGATHKIGGVGIATDVYVIPQMITVDDTGAVGLSTFGEFDIGVEIPAGPLLFIPMVGIGADWSANDLTYLIAPQLFTYGNFGPVYLEWWSQFFWSGLFNDADTAGSWYNRLFVTYALSDEVKIGPQVEMSLSLDGDGITSLPVGANLTLGYGDKNTLQLFGGYETQDESQVGDKALAGRITFVRYW